ncbi:MAG: M28 family peptidase, partial [Gemmatimonadota bacterium]|nr:M28 family peptidase [Gemmatimonadota bacterium]
NRIGNESPGAMDNATGVSVLLEAARTFPTDPALADAELLFVATGAEEIGLGGALRWIQTHESECPRDRTAVLNLDSVGVGRGVLGLDIHGGLPGGLRMTDAFRKAAVASGVKARRIRVLPGVGVDTMPISSRGYSTVTLLGRVPGGASVRIHTARDTAEHLCEAGLRDAATVLTELARMAAKPVG